MAITVGINGFGRMGCLNRRAAGQELEFVQINDPAGDAATLARLFLFGARDVWFVVALPMYIATQLGWIDWSIGVFFAVWVITYCIVQSCAPLVAALHVSIKSMPTLRSEKICRHRAKREHKEKLKHNKSSFNCWSCGYSFT
ncbi:MAG: hypothetical protein RL571_1007 [Pseudomonadota bacterium]|jgi:hypothetical protein